MGDLFVTEMSGNRVSIKGFQGSLVVRNMTLGDNNGCREFSVDGFTGSLTADSIVIRNVDFYPKFYGLTGRITLSRLLHLHDVSGLLQGWYVLGDVSLATASVSVKIERYGTLYGSGLGGFFNVRYDSPYRSLKSFSLEGHNGYSFSQMLNGITEMEEVVIAQNPDLGGLDASFRDLERCGTLTIKDTQLVTIQLDTFPKLKSLNSLTIQDNAQLHSMFGPLFGFTVNGSIAINNNPSLASLVGLCNLKPSPSLRSINLEQNPALCVQDITAIFPAYTFDPTLLSYLGADYRSGCGGRHVCKCEAFDEDQQEALCPGINSHCASVRPLDCLSKC